jgi:zona occludens toxin (predicted ATPase)
MQPDNQENQTNENNSSVDNFINNNHSMSSKDQLIRPTLSENQSLEKDTPKKSPSQLNNKVKIAVLFLVFIAAMFGAYSYGKHGERVIVKKPDAPPISLPPQAIVMNECVAGVGKQYVIPKDIPNGPIYDVKNSKVIAVEYNYKAADLLNNPTKLSDTVIPLTKNYEIDHFSTSTNLIENPTFNLSEVQNIPVHLVFYVVPQSEAQSITCSSAKS